MPEIKNKINRPLRVKKTGMRIRFSASLTVEAALVLPILLFFCVNILYVTEMIRLQSNLTAALHQTGTRIGYYAYYYEYAPEGISEALEAVDTAGGLAGAVASLAFTETYVRSQVVSLLGKEYLDHTCLQGGSGSISYLRSSILQENGLIELTADYRAGPFFPFPGYSPISLQSKYYGHAWVGYEIGGTASARPEEEDEETVFVTPNGRVYHRDETCTYLLPRVRAVSAAGLGAARNESGGRYYACETCRPGRSGTLYITEYGNRYHSSRNCSTILRTVREVKLSQVAGRMAPCSKCGY